MHTESAFGMYIIYLHFLAFLFVHIGEFEQIYMKKLLKTFL